MEEISNWDKNEIKRRPHTLRKFKCSKESTNQAVSKLGNPGWLWLPTPLLLSTSLFQSSINKYCLSCGTWINCIEKRQTNLSVENCTSFIYYMKKQTFLWSLEKVCRSYKYFLFLKLLIFIQDTYEWSNYLQIFRITDSTLPNVLRIV